MESSSGTAAGVSRGGKGKSALDKKPLGEVFGNKDVNSKKNNKFDIGIKEKGEGKSKIC
jgi:hypothetical protein